MTAAGDIVLSVQGLQVAYGGGPAAVTGLSFDLRAGQLTALVGPSGSGKSTVALAIMRLLQRAGRITAGSIGLRGGSDRGAIELVAAGEETMRRVRGRRIGMIFQSAGTALNPVMSVKAQIGEALALAGVRPRARRAREVERLLAEVELDAAVARAYPHQLSGGMQQRVMISMALAGGPEVLLADEPTSALDVTVQAGILRLLKRLQIARQMAVLLITHDIAVAGEIADEVLVLAGGRLVEAGSVRQVLGAARTPTTQRLVAAARAMALRPDEVAS